MVNGPVYLTTNMPMTNPILSLTSGESGSIDGTRITKRKAIQETFVTVSPPHSDFRQKDAHADAPDADLPQTLAEHEATHNITQATTTTAQEAGVKLFNARTCLLRAAFYEALTRP